MLFVLVMFLADSLGIPIVRGNPLPETVQKWIEKHPEGTVCGTVYKCEDTSYSQAVYLKKSYLIYKSEKIPIENIKVYMKAKQKVPMGAVIVVSGNLKETEKSGNPGGFDEQSYYACQHIFYLMKSGVVKQVSKKYSVYRDGLEIFRQYMSQILWKYAGDDASIFQAMLLGDKDHLEKDMKTLYQIGGIIHILAISGLHINMLGMGIYEILKKLGIGMAAAGFLALFLMLQYGMMTGNGVATLRAVCMFVLNVGAQLLGRIYDMPTAMALAAVLVLMESPAYLYNSSFQLSFGAVVAVGMIYPVLQELLHIRGKWMGSFISSFSVQLVTLPIVLCTYGEVSVIGVFLNLLVLPTVQIVLGSGVLGCMTGVLREFSAEKLNIAEAVFIPGRIILRIYEKLCNFAGNFSFCTWIAGTPETWQILLYYSGLILILLIMNSMKNKTHGVFVRRMVFLSGTILAMVLIDMRKMSDFEITCLDVGQGDCVVLETKEHKRVMIDCGSVSEKDVGKYDLIPFLKHQGIARLDCIVISHTDKDHVSGIEELLEDIGDHMTAIRVGCLVLPEWEEKSEMYMKLEELAKKAGTEIFYVNTGDLLEIGEMELEVLHPSKNSKGTDTNEEGVVLQVQYQDFRGLFMGDVSIEVENLLLSEFKDVDFLKVGHHGSKYSTGKEFLQVIQAEYGMISCGKGNSYGHPDKETVKRLEDADVQVEYTMKHGAIIYKVVGNTVFAEHYVNEQ